VKKDSFWCRDCNAVRELGVAQMLLIKTCEAFIESSNG
jgi:hypothetical protein